MKMLFTMLPTVILVVYSQLVMKWRVTALGDATHKSACTSVRLGIYLLDPFVLSSYVAALIGSVLWLFVVERYPISIAFPVYVGLTVGSVACVGPWLFREEVTVPRLVAILLIIAGVIIGSRS
jgi:multidrug transporter EmrE-like cation transporter